MKSINSAGVLCSLLALSLGGAAASGCGSGSSAGTGGGDTTRLVGYWSLERTSGGLSGNGYEVTPGMEILTFNGNGTFARTVSGQTTTGTYGVAQRKTFLSTEEQSVITYRPSNGDASLPDVITQVDSQHLALNEEAADGFGREYERTVQTN